jgi:hypothetical protein
MSREAKLELNSNLKEFEQAKRNQTTLHKVQLDFTDSLEDDNLPFSEMVQK